MVAAACTSSIDPIPSTSSSSSGSTSSSSGSTSSSSGSTSSSSGGSGVNRCPPSTGQSDCPQAELEAYSKCATEKCDAEYKECYGTGYATGNWGGPCGPQITCATKCECADSACFQKCAGDQACTTCSQKLGQCITKSCKLPCQGDTKTCADLETCCGKITDSTKKSQCDAQLNAVKASGDVACNAVYTSFANDCK